MAQGVTLTMCALEPMLMGKRKSVHRLYRIFKARNVPKYRKTGRQLCDGLNKGDEGLSSQLLQFFKYLQGTSFISVTYIAT